MNKYIFITSVIMIFFLQGCFSVSVVRSSLRQDELPFINLSGGIKITSLGAITIGGDVEFLPSGMKIENNGMVMYIDPVEIDNPVPADYVLYTHAHPDHFLIADLQKILKDNTVIIGPKKIVKALPDYNVVYVEPGSVVNYDEFSCEAIAAYNLKPVFLWIKAHPKADNNVGYILSINNTRMYYSGDTDFIPDMETVTNITAAFVPIDGDNLTMNIEQAAAALNHIQPEIAVPVHYEFEDGKTDRFKSLIDEDITVEILE